MNKGKKKEDRRSYEVGTPAFRLARTGSCRLYALARHSNLLDS